MTSTGSTTTRLVVLRGSSGSGKTTVATALRAALGGRAALVEQDYFRRVVLAEPGRGPRSVNMTLINLVVRHALEHGYDVVLEGIFNEVNYGEMLERLAADHAGLTRFYAFDVGFDETLRRHATRALASEFGEAEMREWYRGWQPLSFVDETRITAEPNAREIVRRIVADLARLAPDAEA